MGKGAKQQIKALQKMQSQMAQMQEQAAGQEIVGQAGNHSVTVVLSGSGEMKSLTISPEVVDPEDVEGLQELILEAYSRAYQTMNEKQEQQFSDLSQILPF